MIGEVDVVMEKVKIVWTTKIVRFIGSSSSGGSSSNISWY